MTDYGVTLQGFVIKRLENIKAETESLLKAAFGANINLNPASVFGQLTGLSSFVFTLLWELAADVHASFDPDKAEGTSLDAICALTNTERIPAQPTIVQAVVIGEEGANIPKGTQVSNVDSGDVYEMDEMVVITAINAVQVWVDVVSVENMTSYGITVAGTPYVINSGTNATKTSILSALMAVINAGTQAYAQFDDLKLVVTAADDPTSFEVSSLLTIEKIGSRANFTCVKEGPLILPAGKLTEIETPKPGLLGVNNLQPGITGRVRENDEELRVRRKLNINIMAQHNIDSMYSRLSGLQGVKDVLILQNNTDEYDALGTPPHHVWPIVYGGSETQIAQQIFAVIPGGIGMRGKETQSVKSTVTGQEYTIKFDRPIPVEVYIKVNITVTDQDLFPTNGSDLIKEALKAYGDKQKIGQPLVYNRLFCPVYQVPGMEVDGLFIGQAPEPTGTSNIVIAINKIIELDKDRIEVNIAT